MVDPYREMYPSLVIVHPANDAALQACFEIRRKVFVDEQHVDETEEYDEFDQTARQVLVLHSAAPVATARWRPTAEGIKIERMAVLKEWRERGIGSAMLRWILRDIKGTPGKVYLHAQRQAIYFYERHGFVGDGEFFIEADIEHQLMVLQEPEV